MRTKVLLLRMASNFREPLSDVERGVGWGEGVRGWWLGKVRAPTASFGGVNPLRFHVVTEPLSCGPLEIRTAKRREAMPHTWGFPMKAPGKGVGPGTRDAF